MKLLNYDNFLLEFEEPKYHSAELARQGISGPWTIKGDSMSFKYMYYEKEKKMSFHRKAYLPGTSALNTYTWFQLDSNSDFSTSTKESELDVFVSLYKLFESIQNDDETSYTTSNPKNRIKNMKTISIFDLG